MTIVLWYFSLRPSGVVCTFLWLLRGHSASH